MTMRSRSGGRRSAPRRAGTAGRNHAESGRSEPDARQRAARRVSCPVRSVRSVIRLVDRAGPGRRAVQCVNESLLACFGGSPVGLFNRRADTRRPIAHVVLDSLQLPPSLPTGLRGGQEGDGRAGGDTRQEIQHGPVAVSARVLVHGARTSFRGCVCAAWADCAQSRSVISVGSSGSPRPTIAEHHVRFHGNTKFLIRPLRRARNARATAGPVLRFPLMTRGAGGGKRFISEKTERFGESVIREMTRQAMEYEAINLAQGFPDFAAPEELKRAAQRAIADDLNQYPITWGARNLRDAIARQIASTQGLEVDPEAEITVCCGSTEAMIASLLAVTNAGDEIVIFEPFYENYGPDGILSGAIPRFVKLRPPAEAGGEWTFDEKELRSAFNARTKAVVLNTPN